MLERRTYPQSGDPDNPLALYVSPLLERAVGEGHQRPGGVGSGGPRHGFTTRLGGVSTGPFASLNLGNPNGQERQDFKDNLAVNHRRIFDAAGLHPALSHCRVHQVHGADVVTLSPGAEHDPHVKADAIVSDDPSRVISVRIADCVPILLSSSDGAIVAAAHAGWRGVVAGIVPKTIRHMMTEVKHALLPGDLIAAVGPCIGMDAFEVGPEVVAEFARVFDNTEMASLVRPGKLDRNHIDLRAAVKRQLVKAGLLETNIDITDRCTHRDSGEFFSHRRESGLTGRLAGFIAAKKVGSPSR